MVLPNYISTRIYNMPLKKRKNEFMKIFENHENAVKNTWDLFNKVSMYA